MPSVPRAGLREIDELARQSALPALVVASTLMMLELKGTVRQIGSMSYTLAR
ncbi:MAG TPA: hypothetical protein VF221_01205 [Chloroflexota bacterium]